MPLHPTLTLEPALPLALPGPARSPLVYARSSNPIIARPGRAVPTGDRSGLWLRNAAGGLCVLAAAAAAVSFTAQYRMVDATRHRPGKIIHACENPQVLQRLAMADVEHPVACMSGNPAAAGMILLARTAVLYHGDFDWPGIAIARRIFDRGAHPWRFGRIDYLDAVDRLPADNRLGLSGPIQATPWDEALGATMMAADVAIHEELTVDMLLSDLQ
jgi:uncharacterized protein (TIGR02679 family)